MDVHTTLGFSWDWTKVPTEFQTKLPARTIEQVTVEFDRKLAVFVWDAAFLEGNPITFNEVKTLLDGATVGRRSISDQEQVLRLAQSAKRLFSLVRAGTFALNKSTFTEIHALVANREALEWGNFRGEGTEKNYTPDVALGEQGRYTPLPTIAGAPELNRVFTDGVTALDQDVTHPFERAAAFFLFGALQQFFFDGNKRTSRFMMNGILMSAGIDAISVPAAQAQAFNEKMVRFYISKDATEMMAFLVSCHPDFAQ